VLRVLVFVCLLSQYWIMSLHVEYSKVVQTLQYCHGGKPGAERAGGARVRPAEPGSPSVVNSETYMHACTMGMSGWEDVSRGG
jgi:hypothetical protein